LIRAEARVSVEKEIAQYGDRANEARREYQRTYETTEKARSELRSLLMTHLSLLDKTEIQRSPAAQAAPAEAPEAPAGEGDVAANGSTVSYVDL
jgi:hypothetical protein